MRVAIWFAAALLVLAGELRAQDPCLWTFPSASSSVAAGGSGATPAVQSVENASPDRAACPPLPEPLPAWVRLTAMRAGPAAATEFHYRVLENFESTARTATIRVHGAAHQVQQSAGPSLGRLPRMALRGADALIRVYAYGAGAAVSAPGLQAASAPGVFQGQDCQVEVVIRDTENRLAANALNACTGVWGGWRNLAGSVAGRPAVVRQPSGLMLAVVRNAQGAYWLRRYTPGATTGDWLLMGGVFVSDPVMTVDGAGVTYIAARDLWNTLWIGRVNTAGLFLGWSFAGGHVRGQPAMAAGSGGVIYIATRDPWGGLSLLRWRDHAPLGWTRGGDGLGSDPVVAAPGDGLVHIAALSETGSLQYRTFAEGSQHGWGPWTHAGVEGRFVTAAAAGEALFGLVDAQGQLHWHRPATGEWRSLGVHVAGAGVPAAAP